MRTKELPLQTCERIINTALGDNDYVESSVADTSISGSHTGKFYYRDFGVTNIGGRLVDEKEAVIQREEIAVVCLERAFDRLLLMKAVREERRKRK